MCYHYVAIPGSRGSGISSPNPAGIDDPELRQLAKCGRSQKHECRALHRLIHRTGRTLPVRVSEVLTPVKIPGKRRRTKVNFPVLYPTSWARQILSDGGKLLLAGSSIETHLEHSGAGFNMLGPTWTSTSKAALIYQLAYR